MLNNRKRNPNVYRDAFYLSTCSEDAAIAWLKDRPAAERRYISTRRNNPDVHAPEYILYRRKSAALDYALAEHGQSETVLVLLYKRSCQSVRVTLCMNENLIIGDQLGFQPERPSLITHIITKGTMAEVHAICENEGIIAGNYARILKAWQPEHLKVEGRAYVSEERFLSILQFLSKNPTMKKNHPDGRDGEYMDYLDWEAFDQPFKIGWKLAEIAPVNDAWAQALVHLFGVMRAPMGCIKDIEAVLGRWRVENESEYAETGYVRQYLAKAFMPASLEMLNHNDRHLRLAFYQKFNPDAPEFADLDWKQWLERDPDIYFYIQFNEHVWLTAASRKKLRDMLNAEGIDDKRGIVCRRDESRNYYSRIEILKQEKPQWFPRELAENSPNEAFDYPTQEAHLYAELQELMASRYGLLVILIVGVLIGWLIG